MAHRDRVVAFNEDGCLVFDDIDEAARAFNVEVDTIRSHIYDKEGEPLNGYSIDYKLEIWDVYGD